MEVSADIANTTEVADAVLAGSAELGFVEGEVEEGVLSRRRIGADKLVVVVGLNHPWAGREALDAADAPSTDWVLREAGSGTRAVFEAALAKAGVDPATLPVTLTLPGNEAVLTAVEAGAGATAISASAASAGLRAGVLHALDFDLPDRPYWLIRHKERYRSKAGDAFLKIAEAMA